MILVLGSVVVTEAGLREALSVSLQHVQRSRLEPGCIMHSVHQDAERPRRLVFVEKWATPADLWEHFKLPASRDFVKNLGALATEAPSIAIYEAQAVPTPPQFSS